MKTALALAFTLLTGCVPDNTSNFVGTYRTQLVAGGQSFVDTIAISEGETADLIITSGTMGPVRATIIGDTSFAIEQQQITTTDATGKAVSLTLQGQGTVNDGVLAATGQLSTATATVTLQISGSRQ